jgi:hypothetical protein
LISIFGLGLTQWAEDNIPEGLSIFGLGLCEFNRKRLRMVKSILKPWLICLVESWI